VADEASEASATFARRLTHLYRTSRGPGNAAWTDADISGALAARGHDLSPSYLRMLRRGQRTNPTLQIIEALADFFGVPTGYFFDPGEDPATVAGKAAVAREVTQIALDAMARIVRVAANGGVGIGSDEPTKPEKHNKRP
jgi:transcriptional regulator with XRE-family HTH domain